MKWFIKITITELHIFTLKNLVLCSKLKIEICLLIQKAKTDPHTHMCDVHVIIVKPKHLSFHSTFKCQFFQTLSNLD